MPSLRSLAAASQGEPAALRLAEELSRRIGLLRFKPIYDRFRDASPDPGYSKYLDYPSHIARACRHAQALGLVGAPKQRILELGSGPGYFAFAGLGLGHDVVAVDLGDNEMYNALIDLMGIARVVHRIQPDDFLPTLDGRFDFCTAFQVCFDRTDGHIWGPQHWARFLSVLAERYLVPTGRIYLGLNSFQTEAPDAWARLELWLLQHGGRRTLDGFYFQDLTAFRSMTVLS